MTTIITVERGEGGPDQVLSDAGVALLRAMITEMAPGAGIEVQQGCRIVDWVRVHDPERPTWTYLSQDNRDLTCAIRDRIQALVEDALPGPEPGKLRTEKQHQALIAELAYDVATFQSTWDREELVALYSRSFDREVRFLGRKPIAIDPAEWPALVDDVLASLKGVDYD